MLMLLDTDISVQKLKILAEELKDAQARFRFDITNSNFRITSNNVTNLVNTNNQEINDTTKIKEAITKKAVSEAVATIRDKYEMGAQASADLEAYASSKVNDSSLTTTQDIISAANNTKLSVDMNGAVTLNINGSFDRSNVDITQGNMAQLRTELIMQAATDLGKSVAADIIQEAHTKGGIESEGTGLASYQKAIADGLTSQANALKPVSMFGGLFGMLGMGGIGVLIGLFVLYKFTGFGFKIGLIIALIFGIYLAIAYFVGLPPFSKENNETDLVQRLYDDMMKYLIIPRRKVLFDILYDTLTAEKIRVMSLENGSQSYLDKLNNAQEWIKQESGKPFLLTRLSNSEPGPPNWFKSVIYNVERDTYNILINMLEDVTNNNGDVFRDKTYPGPVIPRLKEDRDELTQFFKMYILDPFESDNHDVAYVSAINGANLNPPREWQRVLSEYQGWKERGRPSIQDGNVNVNANANSNTVAALNPYAMASMSSMSRRRPPMAMDYQQAAGTYGQGYAMAMDTQQAAGTYGQGYPMAGGIVIDTLGPPMAMDNQQSAGTFGQGYAMAMDTQQAYGTAPMAQPVQLQKRYTKEPKKSHEYDNQKKKTMYDNLKKRNIPDMQKKQVIYDSAKALSNVGGEVRIAKMVQSEYSRKDRKSIKPVYNKNPVFKTS
jgi:hypothetical protein